MPEMQQRADATLIPTKTTASDSSANNAPSHDARESAESQERDPHQAGVIPPWLHVNNSNDDARLLPSRPGKTVPNSRHYRPPQQPPSHYKLGRKWDHLRSPSPPLLSVPITDHQQRWRPFMYSGPNPQEQQAQARVVGSEWIARQEGGAASGPGVGFLDWREEDELAADGSGGVNGGLIGGGFQGLMYRGKWLISPERQERTVRLFWRLLLKNPFVPLIFRLFILAFSAAGLGIAARIYENVRHVNQDPDALNNCSFRASTYMALVVGSIAIPYLGYVTWDEYTSRPLGLRSVAAKTLLLLCDLYFVVFAASNLSLAFDALYDHRWACYDEHLAAVSDPTSGTIVSYNVPSTCPNNTSICSKQKSLSAILLISLVAWLVTFSISVLRVVEKLRPD